MWAGAGDGGAVMLSPAGDVCLNEGQGELQTWEETWETPKHLCLDFPTQDMKTPMNLPLTWIWVSVELGRMLALQVETREKTAHEARPRWVTVQGCPSPTPVPSLQLGWMQAVRCTADDCAPPPTCCSDALLTQVHLSSSVQMCASKQP